MRLKFCLTDNKGVRHLVDFDIFKKLKNVPLSSLNGGYAVLYKGTGRRNGLLLHRFIMNAKSGEVVDHINRNKSDSRRKNLRTVTRQGNAQNIAGRSASGFKGVVAHRGGFCVYFRRGGRTVNLGIYDKAEVAARVWDAASLKTSSLTPLNFPDSTKDYVPPFGSRHGGSRRDGKLKGVRLSGKRIEGQITHNKKVVYLGSFSTEIEAAKAYDRYVLAHDLPLHRLNFPPEAHPEKGRKAAAARKKR